MTPSVGRIVHYHPADTHGKTASEAGLRVRKGQPYAAIVTHVWSDTCVNLRVIDDATYLLGSGSALPSVSSCTLGDPASPPEHGYWSWPPRV